MTETTALETSARIMFTTLNNIFQLHTVEPIESETYEIIDGCKHCSAISNAIVHYPCPTVILLTEHMVEQPANEETPAE